MRDPPVPFWPVWKQGLWYVAQWYHQLPANDQTFYMQQALSGAMRITSPDAVKARMERTRAACASSARASKKARVADEGGDGVSVKSAERMFTQQHRMAMKKELKEMRDEQKVLEKAKKAVEAMEEKAWERRQRRKESHGMAKKKGMGEKAKKKSKGQASAETAVAAKAMQAAPGEEAVAIAGKDEKKEKKHSKKDTKETKEKKAPKDKRHKKEKKEKKHSKKDKKERLGLRARGLFWDAGGAEDVQAATEVVLCGARCQEAIVTRHQIVQCRNTCISIAKGKGKGHAEPRHSCGGPHDFPPLVPVPSWFSPGVGDGTDA